MDELGGKVAVVTGGASGIGYALCELFAREGMRVVMSDVAPDRLDEAARRLEAATGADVLDVPADVTRWEDVEGLAARAVERFGGVHVLCNNAGVQRDGYTGVLARRVAVGPRRQPLGDGLRDQGVPARPCWTGRAGARREHRVDRGARRLPAARDVRGGEGRRHRIVGDAPQRPARARRADRRLRPLSRADDEQPARAQPLAPPGGADDAPISLVTDVERTPATEVAAQVSTRSTPGASGS